jgi:hypothetical protein
VNDPWAALGVTLRGGRWGRSRLGSVPALSEPRLGGGTEHRPMALAPSRGSRRNSLRFLRLVVLIQTMPVALALLADAELRFLGRG